MLPKLHHGLELCPLHHASEANQHKGWILRGAGVQRSAALGAKELRSSIATLRDFIVALRFTAQNERLDRCSDSHAKRSTGENLAVGAMAHHHACGINLGGKGDQATMAGAVNLHSVYLELNASGRLT